MATGDFFGNCHIILTQDAIVTTLSTVRNHCQKTHNQNTTTSRSKFQGLQAICDVEIENLH
jgi:hypothetical protein